MQINGVEQSAQGFEIDHLKVGYLFLVMAAGLSVAVALMA